MKGERKLPTITEALTVSSAWLYEALLAPVTGPLLVEHCCWEQMRLAALAGSAATGSRAVRHLTCFNIHGFSLGAQLLHRANHKHAGT